MFNVVGFILLLIFYLIILIIGIFAARWYDGKLPKFLTFISCLNKEVVDSENALKNDVTGGRGLPLWIGIFTITATCVGGGFINGSAESIVSSGLVWTIAPLGITFGYILGGFFYAGPMRQAKYLTMLDPFQDAYGIAVSSIIFTATLFADLLWTASILKALGTSLSIIIGLSPVFSVLGSAIVVAIYTLLGRFWSVAFTDVIQLCFVVFGLVLCLPFIFTYDSNVAKNFVNSSSTWLGHISNDSLVSWFDFFIAMTFGSIPWQEYFQRILAMRTTRHAKLLSVVGGFISLMLAVPPILIGAVGSTFNWTSCSHTEVIRSNDFFDENPLLMENNTAGRLASEHVPMILPLVLQCFTPAAVSILGLTALSAAVMSSTDSSILASSSLFTHNIYAPLFSTVYCYFSKSKVYITKNTNNRLEVEREIDSISRSTRNFNDCCKKLSNKHLAIVQRMSILLITTISCVLALSITTINGLFVFSGDLVFVLLFPQLTCVLFCRNYCNSYGAITGYIIALVMRFGAGESSINMPGLFGSDFYVSQLPYRTIAACLNGIFIVTVSQLVEIIFRLRRKFNDSSNFDDGTVDNMKFNDVSNIDDNIHFDSLKNNDETEPL